LRTDKWLYYFTCALITIGMIFSLSLSSYTVLLLGATPLHFFYRQCAVGIACIAVMWIVSRADPDKCLTPVCMSLFAIMGILMLAMGFLPKSLVADVNGAARWIRLPFFNLAPVEFFKVGFIYFLAWSFSRKLDHSKKSIGREIATLLPYVALFGFVVILVAIVQNDLGQVAVLGLTMIFMSLFAGTSFKLIGFSFMGILGLAYVFIVTSAHRVDRVRSWWGGVQDFVLSFMSPETAAGLRIEDASAPYQVGHSLNAINNGEFFGQGLGLGSFKLGYLSEVHTDFVLAGIAEEWGFVGSIVVVSMFFLFIYRILFLSERQSNIFARVYGYSVAGIFIFHVIINIGMVVGIVPVIGIPLPFFSYGGSSLLAFTILLFIFIKLDMGNKVNI